MYDSNSAAGRRAARITSRTSQQQPPTAHRRSQVEHFDFVVNSSIFNFNEIEIDEGDSDYLNTVL